MGETRNTSRPALSVTRSIETLKAAEILVKEGFTVYCPILTRIQCWLSGFKMSARRRSCHWDRHRQQPGLETRAQIEIIIKQAAVPVVVDAGIGAPSHAAEALEMGADAVLVNTAIAAARDPVRMARAFKAAVECARKPSRLVFLRSLITRRQPAPSPRFEAVAGAR